MANNDLIYSEDFDFEDYYPEPLEEDLTYIEDYDLEDYGLVYSDVYEDCEEEEEYCDETLTEDLNSSLPVHPMSEAEVRSAARKVVKGAKVKFGYFKELKLDANYAQGKFVKSKNKQYDLVKAIKVTTTVGCTGVNYDATEGAIALHSTQEYQDKLAARKAATGKGFGYDTHDSEKALENILVTTGRGKLAVRVFPLSTSKPRNEYYISVNGEDWRKTTKEEIAQYMSTTAADEFLHPEKAAAKIAKYQAKIYNANGVTANVAADELTIVDAAGEKLKIKTHPISLTYKDPVSPFYGIFQFDKESAIVSISVSDPADADLEDPFSIDFPSVGD